MKRARLAWCTGVGLVAAWVILGVFLDHNAVALTWLARVAQTAGTVCPLAFILLYTALGLVGGAKWWKTDIGTNIVWLEAAVVCTSGILAWAFIFNHGSLTNPILGWAYIGGLLAAAFIITWRSVIWLRADLWARRRERENGQAGKP